MMGRALTLNTRDNYTKVWADAIKFHVEVFGESMQLPWQPGNVAMYVLYLKDNQYQVNMARQKLSAITYLHSLHRLGDPCKDVVVLNVVKVMTRVHVPFKQNAL